MEKETKTYLDLNSTSAKIQIVPNAMLMRSVENLNSTSAKIQIVAHSTAKHPVILI